MRKGIFIDHLKFNEAHDPEVEGHTVGVNEFSDSTPEEFSSLSGTAYPSDNQYGQQYQDLTTALNKAGWVLSPNQFDSLPKSFDWREHGVVTAVRN